MSDGAIREMTREELLAKLVDRDMDCIAMRKERDEAREKLTHHKHTDECLSYAAQTGKPFCIAPCAESREAEERWGYSFSRFQSDIQLVRHGSAEAAGRAALAIWAEFEALRAERVHGRLL